MNVHVKQIPAEWSRTGSRAYRHGTLEVELRLEPAGDGRYDVEFVHEDDCVRCRTTAPGGDAGEVARGLMETFDDRYPHTLTPSDADRDTVRVALRGTIGQHRG